MRMGLVVKESMFLMSLLEDTSRPRIQKEPMRSESFDEKQNANHLWKRSA
jgi:hypothetical protein